MADKHNDDIPVKTNNIEADLVSMKENFEYHKDVFQNFCTDWSNTDATGIFPKKIVSATKTADYTVTATDIALLADGSGANVTITLEPVATAGAGRLVIIKATDISNQVTIDPDGAETVDGSASFAFSFANESVWLMSDGSTGWQILSKHDTPGAFVVPSGLECLWPAGTPPSGWLEEDGGTYSMSTYEDLFDVFLDAYGQNTGVTFTTAHATDIMTSASHLLTDGLIVTLTNSGGALPSGLSAGTKYFVISASTNTFQLSATSGGAAIDYSDDGTGTHSFHTQFKVPDMRGEFVRGWDNGAGTDPDAATRTDRGDGTTGDAIGTKQADELKSHTHGSVYISGSVGGGNTLAHYASGSSAATGGNETRPRNVNKMFVIKY